LYFSAQIWDTKFSKKFDTQFEKKEDFVIITHASDGFVYND